MTDDRLAGIAIELIRTYGYSLLEDPDRLAQLLEDRCGDSRREIFMLSFALRELLKDGSLPDADALASGSERIEARLRENLGFSGAAAQWVTVVLYGLISAGAETEPPGSRVEARRGFLRNVDYVIAKRPRTALVRKKALRNGLLLIGIIALFLGLFVRIIGPGYVEPEEHGVLFFAHLSGQGAALGHVKLKAAQLAADQINSEGRIRGRYVRVKAHDIPQSPEEAVRAVDALMRDKSGVAAAVSVCGDEVNAAIAGVADAREMPLVVAESSGMAVTMAGEDRPRLYPFRMNCDNLYKGYIAAYFLTHGLKRTRPALILMYGDADSPEMRDGFREALGNFGGTVRYEGVWSGLGGVEIPEGEIAASGADSAVILSGAPDAARAVDALRKSGYGGVALGVSPGAALDAAGGAALDGTWWIVPAWPDDPQLQSFQAAYRDKYNESVSRNDFTGTLFAYDAVYWVKDALLRAPGFQGEAMRHAFMSTRNLPLSHATLTIDPRTHGPWNKAAALVYRTSGAARFDRRFRPPAE